MLVSAYRGSAGVYGYMRSWRHGESGPLCIVSQRGICHDVIFNIR